MGYHRIITRSIHGGVTKVTFLLIAAFFASALPAAAQTQLKDTDLQIQIPGLHFSAIKVTQLGDKSVLNIPYLADYIAAVYTYLIGIAGVVAGIMIVIGGFQYLTAGGDAGRVKAAKERITNAIAGVVLTLGAYAILNTVSPSLVKLKGLEIPVVKNVPFSIVEREDMSDTRRPEDLLERTQDQGPAELVTNFEGEHATGTNTAYCKSVEDCKKKCATPDAWPKGSPYALAENQVKPIPDGPGLVGNGQKAGAAMITTLQAAAKEAIKDNMEIIVESGWRSLEKQMQIVCTQFIGNADKEKLIGYSVPWPGASTHGRGSAVAVSLRDKKTGDIILQAGDCKKQAAGESGSKEASEKLNAIMFKAGFSRYQNSLWEFKTGNPICSCKTGGKHCPLYPPRCNRACN